jgi:drug/metabolite transporter (DMT)-like permease
MNASLGYLSASITLLGWTIGTFAFTKASKEANPASVNRVRLLYALLALSLLTGITQGKWPHQLLAETTWEQYAWFGISGFIGLTLGDYFAFTAYRILGGRRTSLFSCFAPGAALIAANFLLDEHINVVGIGGMLLSIVGVFLLISSRKEHRQVDQESHGHFTKGIVFAALGAICQGLGLVLAKKGFNVSAIGFSAIYATWIRMLIATLTVYMIGSFKLNIFTEFKSITFSGPKLKPILIGTLFGPVMGIIFSLMAATNLEVSVAQTLFSLLPATVFFASVLFYKEQIPTQSYVAVFISILGVIVLVWRNNF